MSAKSKIEWTQATWNPVLGCSKVSPGCKGCYAIGNVHRLAGNPNPKIRAANEGLTVIEGHANWTGKVRLIPERLKVPWRRKKPTMYFVNSLSDLFHEDLSDEAIDQSFAVMARCRQHTFQVLTKRAARLRAWAAAKRGHFAYEYQQSPAKSVSCLMPLPNVWLGVSVEDQQRADERIPLLLQTPAAVRFLSVEPLLGPVDLLNLPGGLSALTGWRQTKDICDIPKELRGIDWVIVGGESGPNARPMHPDWVRNIQRQCAAAGVAFFFKQWGSWAPRSHGFIATKGLDWGLIQADGSWFDTTTPWNGHDDDGSGEANMIRVGKRAAGRLLDGRTWDEMPVLRARQ